MFIKMFKQIKVSSKNIFIHAKDIQLMPVEINIIINDKTRGYL